MAQGTQQKRRFTETDGSPVSDLSDDLLAEVLSRLTYKSTRRCKCVCRRWRDIVSNPDHSKNLPQSTLAGFFYETYTENHGKSMWNRRYHNISGNLCPRIGPSLSFLPGWEQGRSQDYNLEEGN
jgi:hypothetical protein